MSDAWRKLPTDDRNKVVELTPDEVLELKLLKDHLAARLDACRRGSFDFAGAKLATDEIRNLERWVATIQRVLLKVVRS